MTTTNTSSHLASDKVNLLELKEWLRREFLSFFEDCNGKKVRYNKKCPDIFNYTS